VDALLGTGFSGAPRAPVGAAIEAINGAGAPVVAVDVPSGVDASTGEVEGAGVRAGLTVTFHAAKVGLWVLPGKAYCGRVEVIEIGIPEGGPEGSYDAGLIRAPVLDLVPPRGIDSTKFSSGSVLVVGGSVGLTGAVCMTCEAAMRAGAGWVRAAVPSSLNVIFEQKLTEAMTVPLPDEDGHLSADGADAIVEAAERADAVVVGPGLGRSRGSFELVRRLVSQLDRPLLLDADGLNAVAEAGLEIAAAREAATVMTPHAGELARLIGSDSREVSAHRLRRARDAASRASAVVVLKGDDTLVVDGDRTPIAVSAGGSAALATAGTGDVLSGVVSSFLAKGLDPFEAASAGVYAHAQAGWLAGTEYGADCVIATDVIAALPAALRRRGPEAD
jgi:NAD(P)H-hydrate epimerase